MSSPSQQQLFTDILAGVSRSFYLTLRVLPQSLHQPIGLAYLLARAADTLADTTVLPAEQRLQHLHSFKRYLTEPESAADCADIQTALHGQLQNEDEQRLLEQLPQLFAMLAAQSQQDRQLIEQVVQTLSDGMVFDLDTFPPEESGEVKALQQQAELERYTYLVAGCVGEFWTRISMAHVPALSHWNCEQQGELGVRFGQGLQMTNILRDLPRDLRIGRCYLPQQWLDQHQLSVEQLLDSGNSSQAKPLLIQGIGVALEHIEAAQQYVMAIPKRCLRLRLAALWPLMIGLATLEQLAASDVWLDERVTIKVERRWVYRMMLKSLLLVVSDTALGGWIATVRARVLKPHS